MSDYYFLHEIGVTYGADTSRRYRIARSRPGTGVGLFTQVPIASHEFVIEYMGQRILTLEADRLKTRYLFEIDETWTIDGSSRSNIARYINHACDPNCRADIVGSRIMFFAKHDITTGEELTVDYGNEYFEEFIRPIGCKCGKCSLALMVNC